LDFENFKVSVGHVLATRQPHEDAVEALRSLMGLGHPTGQRWRFVRTYVTSGRGFLGRKAVQHWESFAMGHHVFHQAWAFKSVLREPCPRCPASGFVVTCGGGQRETDLWILCVVCARLTLTGRVGPVEEEPLDRPAPRPIPSTSADAPGNATTGTTIATMPGRRRLEAAVHGPGSMSAMTTMTTIDAPEEKPADASAGIYVRSFTNRSTRARNVASSSSGRAWRTSTTSTSPPSSFLCP
jgi:hypothetical protein